MKKAIKIFNEAMCILMLSTGLIFSSCDKGSIDVGNDVEQGDNENSGNENNGGEQDSSTQKVGPASLSLDVVTATTVNFVGKLDVPSSELFYCEITMYYTDKDSFSVDDARKVTVRSFDKDNCFSLGVKSLQYNKKYNYWFYVKTKTDGVYSEVKTFTTNNITLTLSAKGANNGTSALVTGKVQGVSSIDIAYVDIGIAYSSIESDVMTGRSTKVNIIELGSNNSISLSLDDLELDTQYYYCPYIRYGNDYAYGDVQSFQTPDSYNAQSELDASSAKDLSSSGSANCYIVSRPGVYKFKATKGNSDISVGSVSTAAILWETFGTNVAPERCDLIKSISYENNYIIFQTAGSYIKGNAVIAAKDADGTILWSWHIWITDKPVEHEYYNNAGVVMDRNLGATSASIDDVGAMGLLYQWGRKDPFLGSSSISEAREPKSTITWPSAVDNGSWTNPIGGSIEYVTANPTTFIKIRDSKAYKDWYWYEYHDDPFLARWTESNIQKSIYDPCPSGWRVPDGGSKSVWAKAIYPRTEVSPNGWSKHKYGINLKLTFGGADDIWYPFTGSRSGYSGEFALVSVGHDAYVWSASLNEEKIYCLHLRINSTSATCDPSSDEYPAYALPVRCVKE